MKKLLIIYILTISYLTASNIEVNINYKKEKFQDFLFKEVMNDLNSTNNNYENLHTTQNSVLLNFNGNFDDIIGFSYDRSINGISYDSKEIYFGNDDMRYLSYKKTSNKINYNGLKTKKKVDTLTLFNIIDISKEDFTSANIEHLSDEKNTLFSINQDKVIHRDYTLEKFRLTSEHFYEIAKNDSYKNNTYLLPGIFSKNINSNIKIYGVAILSMVQYNYTNIENYYLDSNGSKTNISYQSNIENQIISLNKVTSSDELAKVFNIVGKYRGFEYGYKATVEYMLNRYSLYLTSYYKITNLKNKHSTDEVGNVSSDLNNVLNYKSLKFTQYYLNFGFKYRF